MVQDTLTKSKRIANLFGLDDEADDVTTGTKKDQETAADWLGIKKSPKKTALSSSLVDEPDPRTYKTDLPIAEISTHSKFQGNNEKSNFDDSKNTVSNKISNKSKADILVPDSALVKPNKIGDHFDLLSDTSGQKSLEIPKEKKSAIFDELFGDSNISQKKLSRRSSVVKSSENIVTEPVG